jgi:hypothetical protein
LTPRLLAPGVGERLCVDVKTAAASLGVSVWTLRSWIDEGLIATVRFPGSKNPDKASRRVLLAVADLTVFVDQHRGGAAR